MTQHPRGKELPSGYAHVYRRGVVLLAGPGRSPFGAVPDPVRDARIRRSGKKGKTGLFHGVTPMELAAQVGQGVLSRSGLAERGLLEDIRYLNFGGGNVPNSGQDLFHGPELAFRLGLSRAAAQFTRALCGSSHAAIHGGALEVETDSTPVVLVGGVEVMSGAPLAVGSLAWMKDNHPFSPVVNSSDQTGYDLVAWLKSFLATHPRPERFVSNWFLDAFCDPFLEGKTMPQTAEKLAEAYRSQQGLTTEQLRRELDEHAAQSFQRFYSAQSTGVFEDEIVPIAMADGTVIGSDEILFGPDETTLEAFAGLQPYVDKSDQGFFENRGAVLTAANSSRNADGSAAMVLASEDYASAKGFKPLARLVASAHVSVHPSIMGYGPVPAIRAVLDAAGMSLSSVGLLEINEAFAVVTVMAQRDLDINPEILNVNGGAMAIGHPISASGSRITMHAVYEARRRNAQAGRNAIRHVLSAICVGGGQGRALLLEIL